MLDKLQQWFAVRCNGDWECNHGILIGTIDNPGFYVQIHIPEAICESTDFGRFERDFGDDDWLLYKKRDKKFEAGCSIFNLEETLSIFLNAVSIDISQPNIMLKEQIVPYSITPEPPSKYLSFLEEWYAWHCNGDWEHSYKNIKLYTTDTPGWRLRINLDETNLEGIDFIPITDHRTEKDWVRCYVKDNAFYGEGGPLNATELLQIFQEWSSPHSAGMRKKRTSPYDPSKWQCTKRYDGMGRAHMNQYDREIIPTPHIHDPDCPGNARKPEQWEMPKGAQ